MRADRLIQALLLLQGRPQITAAELAEELEVSIPTARRDLEALAMSGVPIYPTRGRGGGWRLIGGARTDLTGLTEGEVTSLLIGLSQSGHADPERIAAVRKLVRAMPAPFREGAQRVAASTVRDAPWGEVADEAASTTVAALQRAIAGQRRVRLSYEGTRGSVEFDLVPLVIGSRGNRQYLLGAPAQEESDAADAERLRMYRIDRIRTVSVLPERGAAPDGFDVAAAWARMVERVEDLRGAVRAMVRVEPWAVRALQDRFGAQAFVLEAEPDENGRALLEVRAHRVDALAEQLVGWAGVAEAIGPPEVRAALRELGERITALYRSDGAPRTRHPL
ncbi:MULTISPECIES: YafY family protein [unclassified Microbacterium]|uniref:helix-turn-helix transcriptional regulator n=1 Tax=unclassified Microbacterium TaxID=2609290 RepID=UPI0012FA8A97|nr:WYL domain-containing protein [Microbacterium sp. MAH-37]MVQ40861.1 WYL domain-containing protein [Microbacterium sp. MAH-37]